MKTTLRWYSERIQHEILFARWGHFGRPVLIYPTAGGDAEEMERMLMIKVLIPLIEAGRIKVYSVDSIASRIWGDLGIPGSHKAWMQNQFDAFIHREVVPAIRHDCDNDNVDIVVAGASIGAFNALASICRHPDVFSDAICMSGSYDVERFMKNVNGPNLDLHFSSPMHFLPELSGLQLEVLQRRFVLMCHGGGRWEDPEQDWRAATLLGRKGVPNRVDPWGEGYDHDWPTWRAMLPHYLGQLTANDG